MELIATSAKKNEINIYINHKVVIFIKYKKITVIFDRKKITVIFDSKKIKFKLI